MLNKIILYFKGYLRIRIKGPSTERFINTCSYKGIRIWELLSKKSCYELNITIKDFKKLKPVIRKTKTKVTIVKRTGFPFFISKYRKRKLLLLGAILSVTLLYYLSTFVWNIKIEGNSLHSTESITKYLYSIDIRPGIKSKNIKCSTVSKNIREKYNDITWVSTSLEGSNLVIKIKENYIINTYKGNNRQENPYDIVADENCKIDSIVIRKGVSQVGEGDDIKKGDILISGQIPVYNDAKEIIKYNYCVADADIYGIKKIHYEDTLSEKTFYKKYDNINKQEYYIKTKDYIFSLGGIKNIYPFFEMKNKQISLKDFTFGIRKVIPYEKIQRKYSIKEVQMVLTNNFEYYCRELEKKGVVILTNNVKIYTWSDKAKAKGTLTIKLPIGRIEKSEIIETGDYIDGNDGNNN